MLQVPGDWRPQALWSLLCACGCLSVCVSVVYGAGRASARGCANIISRCSLRLYRECNNVRVHFLCEWSSGRGIDLLLNQIVTLFLEKSGVQAQCSATTSFFSSLSQGPTITSQRTEVLNS